jgi:putative ABC transport system permease protein
VKFFDVTKDAVSNTARNKVRTSLTVVAIFIGAFTLTLTNSIGAGVSGYINNQIGSIGSPTIMTVSNPSEVVASEDDGPEVYEPTTDGNSPGSNFGLEIDSMTEDDIAKIEEITNVDYVERTFTPRPTFIETEGSEKYIPNVNIASSVMVPDLTAGAAFTAETENYEVIIPATYVEALGFTSDQDAVGKTVTFGVTDYTLTDHTVEGVIVGVQNKSLFGETVSLNNALSQELVALQDQGLPVTAEEDKTYWSLIVHFADTVTAEEQTQMKDDLEGLGFEGSTVADQLGSINTVINGIIAVLNAFAIIALIAAGFGIVNTLLMSVQERTREIGLMKAMGMSGKKIYLLFSMEAVFIGFLGSALGAGAAIGLGTVISNVLSNTLLADLPGLTITLFTVPAVAGVIALVMFIAFLAGTIPAQRAAKQNPIDALRYE